MGTPTNRGNLSSRLSSGLSLSFRSGLETGAPRKENKFSHLWKKNGEMDESQLNTAGAADLGFELSS